MGDHPRSLHFADGARGLSGGRAMGDHYYPGRTQVRIGDTELNQDTVDRLVRDAEKPDRSPSTSTRVRGEPAQTGGTKHDANKPDLSLIPPVALREMAKAFQFGAWKYAPFNFERGLSARRLLAATLRHVTAVLEGEDHDTEEYTHPDPEKGGETRTSGAHHLGHALASIAMYLRCSEIGTLTDDRTPIRPEHFIPGAAPTRSAELFKGAPPSAVLSNGMPVAGNGVWADEIAPLKNVTKAGMYRTRDGSQVHVVRDGTVLRCSAWAGSSGSGTYVTGIPERLPSYWHGTPGLLNASAPWSSDVATPLDLMEFIRPLTEQESDNGDQQQTVPRQAK